MNQQDIENLVEKQILTCHMCGGQRGPRGHNKKGDKRKFVCKICGASKDIPIEVIDQIDTEIIKDNVRLAKKVQRFQDTNRVERKAFREHARIENALEALLTDLRDVIKQNKFPPIEDIRAKSAKTLIVHLTDLHFNELVDMVSNRYDFRIASRRLYEFALKVIKKAKFERVNHITVAMTGDLLNSDRRLDEVLTKSTNRAKALFLGVRLLSSFLRHLHKYVDIDVVSVLGNESRVNPEYGFTDALASDNYDFIIYEVMNLLFEDVKGINFVSGDKLEYIISVNGVNFLMVHGDKMGKMDVNQVAKVVAKWAKRGYLIDYIMCGHLHESKTGTILLRAASLVGENDFSDKGLNLVGKASQNILVVNENKSVDYLIVDLQQVKEGDPMYPIEKHLEAYNAKSLDKTREQKTIFEVKI